MDEFIQLLALVAAYACMIAITAWLVWTVVMFVIRTFRGGPLWREYGRDILLPS